MLQCPVPSWAVKGVKRREDGMARAVAWEVVVAWAEQGGDSGVEERIRTKEEPTA